MLLWIALTTAAVFWIVSIADVIAIDENDIVRLSKESWLMLVLTVPVLGGLLWLRRGRATHLPFPTTLPARGHHRHP